MKEALWIIRFANGFLLSHHGTKDEAKTIAERKKDSSVEATLLHEKGSHNERQLRWEPTKKIIQFYFIPEL